MGGIDGLGVIEMADLRIIFPKFAFCPNKVVAMNTDKAYKSISPPTTAIITFWSEGVVVGILLGGPEQN